ncbi:fatty acid-binding protein DegV [Clostridium tetani]|uniref:DegV family protein n=1 Tax=Clostridium tetani TaxID=1513 RepID=UPI00100B84A4|nr:DegV family protein [Clostridium tetani]RXI51013.1 fatty acid-binding protein DegV [Clostridium tetani]RXI51127.1 fatty acid-binding protein DegV [Clostridium tetani]RXM57086.1 fatty acid-binding protein DegV [Clostridium tetani]RXM68264.1 fatty acid-binding protein DegV [Clostridium tetani]RXM78500.1 fatty acid-binding protein DegV [Clostridium tetani]
MNTVILTDSSCDLPLEYIEENNIKFLSLTYNLSYGSFPDDFGKTMSHEKFYNELRKGELSTTSQINAYSFRKCFEELIKENKSILYLGFSSVLSGCINSAEIAKNELLEEYPKADITIINTKSAAIGQGLLILKAVEMLKKGSSKEDIISWIETYKYNMNHWFIVDDLMYLKKGGRLSTFSSAIGTLMNVKPMLTLNNEGAIVNTANIRGRKKAIKSLLEVYEKNRENFQDETIGISHSDCLEDAQYLKELILEKYNIKNILIGSIGPVIGSHTGPNALTLCFLGKKREN